MQMRSLLMLSAVLGSSMLVACCRSPRKESTVPQPVLVDTYTCDTGPSCIPSTLHAGQIDPLPLDNKTSATIAYGIRRDTFPKEEYRVWLGTYGKAPVVAGSAILDLSDALPTTNGQHLASVAVDTGWAAMVRSAQKPPLRTIRITTGRPRLTDSTQQVIAPLPAKTPVEPEPRMAGEYAVLVAIDPNANPTSGGEAYFLATTNSMQYSLTLLVGPQPSSKKVTLTQGQYIVVDRNGTTLPTPMKFPSTTDPVQPASWIIEAITEANASVYSLGYKFGDY